MTAQHGTDNSSIHLRNETQVWVAPQICGYGEACVRLGQPHTSGAPPQCNGPVVIFDTKRANDDSIVVWCSHKINFISAPTGNHQNKTVPDLPHKIKFVTESTISAVSVK
jgi:hypothetical protein